MDLIRASDVIRYMTVQIVTSNDGSTNWTGCGTGFLYTVSKGSGVPLIITNKHVLDGASRIGINFHVTLDNNETPHPGPGRLIHFGVKEVPIVRHPDSSVDLAGIAIVPLVARARNFEGWRPYVKCLTQVNLPSKNMIEDFSSIEGIVTAGYPVGIIDKFNNFPVVRRGITSTPYGSDYQGKKEFLADIPVYGGASGSPIFVLNEGSWVSNGGLVAGTRFALIGILYAGHTETVDGHIVSEPIPTNLVRVAKVKHMINLALCIRSERIEELASEIPNEDLRI